MPVTSNNTTFNDFEGAATTADYGGGQGSAANNDVVIQGTQSWGRRVDNATDKGFGGTATAVDMSANGVHVKAWLFVAQWPSVTAVKLRISSGSDDDHTLPTANYPPLGGFVPIWCDVSRTPEAGGSANEAAINEIGVLLTIADVGGNSPNMILDEILYTSGEGGETTGLQWTGTGGSMDDFRTFENTNNEGNIVTLQGVDFCYSRFHIGDSTGTATTFTDSGFTVIFPDQALVSSNFMGVNIYGRNASSSINLSECTFQSSDPSGATNKPDFQISQTVDNAVNLTSVNVIGFRWVVIGQRSIWNGGIIDTRDIIISSHANTHVYNMEFRTRAGVGGSCFYAGPPDFGTTNGVHDSVFTQVGEGHAILGTTLQSVSTLTNLQFNGYAGNDSVLISTLQIAPTGNTIAVGQTFNTGDIILWDQRNGIQNVGPTDGTNYYVNAIDGSTISLHTTLADAEADTNRVVLTQDTSYPYDGVWLHPQNAVFLYEETALIDYFIDTPWIFDNSVESWTPISPITEYGVAFTGDGSACQRVSLYCYQAGNPDENLQVQIYASTGTYGIDARPTGAALASATVSAASLTTDTSGEWVHWDLSPGTLTDGTVYILTIKKDTGTSGNWGGGTTPYVLGVGQPNVIHSHNRSQSIGGGSWSGFHNGQWAFAVWSSLSTVDEVTINISGGNTPSIDKRGILVTVANSLVWTIEVRVDGALLTNAAEITVATQDATPVELFHVETSVTGSEDYSFDGGDAGTAVTVLVMTDDYEPYQLDTTLPASNGTITVALDEDRVYDNPT